MTKQETILSFHLEYLSSEQCESTTGNVAFTKLIKLTAQWVIFIMLLYTSIFKIV